MVLHGSEGLDFWLREFKDLLRRYLVKMIAEDIPQQLDTNVLQRGDLRQLIRKLVESLLGATELA